jgi:hypothetical protein
MNKANWRAKVNMREANALGSGTESALAEPTIRYIVASQPVYDRLREILTQVAGFSLLIMTRGSRAVALDDRLAPAFEAFRTIAEQCRALRVPGAAAHHHLHVAEAASAVERSIGFLKECSKSPGDDAAREALTRCLRIAADHMRVATRLLPGFEMVDLKQSCCGDRHAPGRLICN